MNTNRAIGAGLVATGTMTALLLIEPSIGLPQIAIGQLLSTSLGLTTALLPSGPAVGWILHFLIGSVLGLIYASVFAHRLPGRPIPRGMLYGVLVFILAQLVFMPLAGGGFFSGGDMQMLVGSLFGHLLFGAVVGWIYDLPASTSGTPSG